MNERLRKRLTQLLSAGTKLAGLAMWLIVLGLTIVLVYHNYGLFLPYWQRADYTHLIWAFLLYLASLSMAVMGWIAIMRPFAAQFDWLTHARSYAATLAARRLPGTFWYIGGRLVLYKQIGVSGTVVSIGSSLELIVSVVSGILIGSILLPFGLELSVPLVVALAGCALAGLVTMHPAVTSAIISRLRGPFLSTLDWRDILACQSAYMAMWILSGLMVAQVIAVFQPLAVGDVIIVIGAWALSGVGGLLTFFLPSTFGASEVALTFLLALIIPVPLAAAIAILMRILVTMFELILAAPFYLASWRSRLAQPNK